MNDKHDDFMYKLDLTRNVTSGIDNSPFKKFDYIDQIFPFHCFLGKIRKNESNLEMTTSKYWINQRYILLNIFNDKHKLRRSKQVEQRLKLVENKYFLSTSALYFLSLYNLSNLSLGKFLPFKLYFSICLLLTGKFYSLCLINKDIDDLSRMIKDDYKKEFRIHENDVLDQTLISDWKCYLYYYNLY